jgi:hypothetical protein
MRSLLGLAALFAMNTPLLAGDFDLMVGLRSTIASYIREGGYACADVTSIDPVGFEDAGSVMRVVCRSPERSTPPPTTAFRVTAYPEGDFSARPWRDGPR